MFRNSLAAVLCASMLFAACGGITSPSKNRSLPFDGTLTVAGINSHPFNTGKNGEFEIRLTALNPSRVLFLGVGIGVVQGGICNLTSNTNPTAQVNRTAVSGPINKGDYCAVVYDPGTVTETTTYSITVSVP